MTCAECAHWMAPTDHEKKWRPHHGTCRKVEYMGDRDAREEKPLAFVQDSEDYKATLYTLPEFSCALWEAKVAGA